MKLLFVYNANSGIFNMIKDAGHKLISPSTYPCSLCALTFDTFSENNDWKTFRKNSNIDMEFYHIDEFEPVYPNVNVDYPVVLKQENNQTTILLSHRDLDMMESLNELIEIIKYHS